MTPSQWYSILEKSHTKNSNQNGWKDPFDVFVVLLIGFSDVFWKGSFAYSTLAVGGPDRTVYEIAISL